jgi:ABC-type sugar transport system permease subunit
MSGRVQATIVLPLPALIVLIGVGLFPRVLIAFWSFGSFDQATCWIKPEFTLDSCRALFATGRLPVFARTTGLAALAAAHCTILAFPAAPITGLMSGPRRAMILIALFTIPFFTSALIRAFAWRLVLDRALVRRGIQMLALRVQEGTGRNPGCALLSASRQSRSSTSVRQHARLRQFPPGAFAQRKTVAWPVGRIGVAVADLDRLLHEMIVILEGIFEPFDLG